MKILAISLLEDEDSEDSDAFEIITLIIQSTVLKKDAIHSIDFSREFVEKHKLWPGTIIKMILYGNENAVTENDDNIEIAATGQRIEKQVGGNWHQLSEDIG